MQHASPSPEMLDILTLSLSLIPAQCLHGTSPSTCNIPPTHPISPTVILVTLQCDTTPSRMRIFPKSPGLGAWLFTVRLNTLYHPRHPVEHLNPFQRCKFRWPLEPGLSCLVFLVPRMVPATSQAFNKSTSGEYISWGGLAHCYNNFIHFFGLGEWFSERTVLLTRILITISLYSLYCLNHLPATAVGTSHCVSCWGATQMTLCHPCWKWILFSFSHSYSKSQLS